MDMPHPNGAADALRRSASEPEAFAEFYRGLFEPVLAYLARRVYDPEIALELAAESFAQAYLARGRFRGTSDGEAEAWIYRIARRQLARYFRNGRVRLRAMERLRIDLPRLDAERSAAIEELAELDGLRSALRNELARVSRSQREALWLRVVEEMSYAEVAERLEISEQAARARVSRGLKTLSTALDGNPAVQEARG
jgi:RNA polymerase sigma factor (sigma-70 family)